MLGEHGTKRGRYPSLLLWFVRLEHAPIPDRMSVEIDVSIENLKDALSPRIRGRAKVVERLEDGLHKREALVIAELSTFVSAKKFVYPRRIGHFPLPILHMRVVRQAKP
jgi:hypothetical protein